MQTKKTKDNNTIIESISRIIQKDKIKPKIVIKYRFFIDNYHFCSCNSYLNRIL